MPPIPHEFEKLIGIAPYFASIELDDGLQDFTGDANGH